jgi:hypothetical protein
MEGRWYGLCMKDFGKEVCSQRPTPSPWYKWYLAHLQLDEDRGRAFAKKVSRWNNYRIDLLLFWMNFTFFEGEENIGRSAGGFSICDTRFGSIWRCGHHSIPGQNFKGKCTNYFTDIEGEGEGFLFLRNHETKFSAAVCCNNW